MKDIEEKLKALCDGIAIKATADTPYVNFLLNGIEDLMKDIESKLDDAYDKGHSDGAQYMESNNILQ